MKNVLLLTSLCINWFALADLYAGEVAYSPKRLSDSKFFAFTSNENCVVYNCHIEVDVDIHSAHLDPFANLIEGLPFYFMVQKRFAQPAAKHGTYYAVTGQKKPAGDLDPIPEKSKDF